MIEFYGGYQVYSESGVDLTLLRENLKRTPTERLRQNQAMLPLIEELRQSRHAQSPQYTQQIQRSGMFEPERLLHQLADYRVQFVMIGGLAMIAHGSAYITSDLDVCYSRTPENIASLAAALEPLHPYLRGVPDGLPFRLDVAMIRAGLNFTLTTDLGDLDLLGEVSGIGNYDQVLSRSVEKTAFGLQIRVLSISGLIAAKKAAGRTKDKLQILELEELQKMLEDHS